MSPALAESAAGPLTGFARLADPEPALRPATSGGTLAVLALDLGTSELKAGLVGLDGRVLAHARAGYATDQSGGRVEQDPLGWWAAVARSVRALRIAAPAVEIVAVCPDAHGPTCVAVDAEGRPTRPAIVWLDPRGAAERAALSTATSLPGWLLGILPAALWIEDHEPEVAAATRWYLAAWEWLGLRLTGVAAATRSTGQAVPDRAAVVGCGIPDDRLPPVVDAGAILGRLPVEVAFELGLAPDIPVVAGLNDAYASCLGAGLLEAGDALDTGGSSGGLVVYTDREPDVPGAWIGPAPVAGRWFVGGAMAATGRALDWLRDEALGGFVPTEDLLDEAETVPPGADGLLFLPYLVGERSPIWDAAARGAFVGLTLRHRRAHLVRAVLEASAYALRHVAEPIHAGGFPIRELRVAGGNARSEAWDRIKADVLGVEVRVPEVLETAMLGSAILGAVGIGAHSDLRAAIGEMVRTTTTIAPDPSTAGVYDARFRTYASLYPALRDAMHELGREPADR